MHLQALHEVALVVMSWHRIDSIPFLVHIAHELLISTRVKGEQLPS
jgi:hypothetical protein